MARLVLSQPSLGPAARPLRLSASSVTSSSQLTSIAKPAQAKHSAADGKPGFPAVALQASRSLEAPGTEEPRVFLAPSSTNLAAWDEEAAVQAMQAQAQQPAEEVACGPTGSGDSVMCEASECAGVLSSAASCSHSAWNHKDSNSVTVKADTSVKQAAGAIVKVLDRLCSTIVTALQQQHEAGAMNGLQYEALNRTVKALAVCRKYLTDSEPGAELSFLPVHRSDRYGREDPLRFSFLAFKSILAPGQQLQASSEADLHVSSASDPCALAAMIVQTVLQHGQAVMKAGGGCALFVAMSAVIRARQTLKAYHAMDVMLVPQWITEDTRAVLGRESKFLQFNLLPSGLHGVLPGVQEAPRAPAIIPVPAHTAAAGEPALAC